MKIYVSEKEANIQTEIMLALSSNGVLVFRQNVGRFKTFDGRYITIGIKGMSDLYGTIEGTGQSVYIETKTPVGKATIHQKRFIKTMQLAGARAGFARSPEEALKIVKGK